MSEVESRPVPRILLDQNVPLVVAEWLRRRRPHREVFHVSELGLQGSADTHVFEWAQANGCVIVTFDKDFADRRSFATGNHCGIVRLRVRPTTVEETRGALRRLFAQVADEELRGALVIVGRNNIRLRPGTLPELGS